MLREDKNAGFYWERRVLLSRVHYFQGTGAPEPVRLSRRRLAGFIRDQNRQPVAVAVDGRRTWWWFEDRFYWDDEGYGPEDIRALVRARQRRSQRQLERAHELLHLEELPEGPTRSPIPREVRRAVFLRDGGACTQCGSTFELQYDHVLPVSRGGATTADNLQILCSECNREKSDDL